MNYNEAMEYIKEAGKKGSVLGLENMRNLMNIAGNVQDELKILHVAGTNGKGSTSAYIAGILMEAGYKVGRYTSPAVFDYLEIFKINDEQIKKEEYAKILTDIKSMIEKMQENKMETPTAFEIETAIAFLYFYRNHCDFVILEVGMGGIEDATNIIKKPLVSVLTPISMDHMQFLGNTLIEIADKKAGIIKKDSRVVSAAQENEVAKLFEDISKEKNSDFILSGIAKGRFFEAKTELSYISRSGNEYETYTKMLGSFQLQNVATAIEAVECLKDMGYLISKENVENGIKNSRWQGRFEKISDKPLVYFDGGHNPGAAINIKETIEIYFTNRKIIYIIGVLADKDYDKVLSLTAALADDIITITPPDNIRALDGGKLRETVKKYNENVCYIDNLKEAYELAKEKAGEDGVVMIFGSLSYLGKIKNIVKQES